MRYSQALIPTVKETPSDAEIASHQLMIRAGLMRKLSSGTYTYLPAGWKTLNKIINIVREEMNNAGAQEILMPSVQPMELWQRTGRDVDYGETMCKFQDRHGRWNVLAPTAEEVVTFVAANELNSYKQLPFNIYQISFKFRDEFRPRFGVLRSREFMMKDAYSFHETQQSLHETYMVMYNTYKRIFKRCGLEYVIVEAESGEMGGSGSHQFTIPCQSGEDVIVYTAAGEYAANIEKAPVDPLPKQAAADAGMPQEVSTPDVGTIEAVCDFLKAKPQDLIKTLIYVCGDDVVVAMVRGDHEVNHEKLTKAVGGKHIELASEDVIRRVTDAKVGFAGPIGIADKVNKLLIDHAVAGMAVGIAGANKSDYHVRNVVPGRDFKLEGKNIEILDIRNAVEGDTLNGEKLLFRRGIEVGQVFKLGTKYSEKIGCKFLNEQGTEQVALMGCYGIGINRIMASAIELGNDADGIIWPVSIAPFEVIIVPVGGDTELKAAEKIYDQLKAAGVDCLLDDRDARGGVKFKDADLLGIPVRVTVGKKSLEQGQIEVKLRSQADKELVALDNAVKYVTDLVSNLKDALKD